MSKRDEIVALPQASVPATPEIPVGTHLFQQKYLYAFAMQAEVANYIRTQAAEEDRERLPEIMEAWAGLQPRVQELQVREAGEPDKIRVTPMPAEHQAVVDAYTQDPLFKRAFASLPAGLALVEVDKLVAHQRMVNLDYVERLSAKIGTAPQMEDLLRTCISPHRELDPIQHLELAPDVHVFSSPNSDMRFLGASVKREFEPDDVQYVGGVPAIAVQAFIGYGAAPASAMVVGARLVLWNGFHRVYALRRLGVTEIPLVLQQVSNPQLELPAQIGQLPRDYLLNDSRPVLMKDFFEPDFTVTLNVRERIKMITLSVPRNEHEVPA